MLSLLQEIPCQESTTPSTKVSFVLGQRSWEKWITPFLSDPKLDTNIIYWDPQEPTAISEIRSELLKDKLATVVFLSHHSTLRRDFELANNLRLSGAKNVICQPTEIAELALSKRQMAKKVETLTGLRCIPELTFSEAQHTLLDGAPVIAKDVGETEGRSFQIFQAPEELEYLRREGAASASSNWILQPFLSGEEYSVVALKGDSGIQLYPPVYKGCTSLTGTHPARRKRSIVLSSSNSLISRRLLAAAEKVCRSLGGSGLMEYEFIIVNDEIYFLELNPRLAGTTRMVAMASDRNIFSELVWLNQGSEPSLEVVPAVKETLEIPCSDLSADIQQQIEKIENSSVSSRITISASCPSELEQKISKIEQLLVAQPEIPPAKGEWIRATAYS